MVILYVHTSMPCSLMQIAHTKGLSQTRLELSYDTCFGIGKFFVNALVFRHPMLEGDPVYPVLSASS